MDEVARQRKPLRTSQPYIRMEWDSNYIKKACERSITTLEGSSHGRHQLSDAIKASDTKNVFLIDSGRGIDSICYWSANNNDGGRREWGSRDLMIDLGDQENDESSRRRRRSAAEHIWDQEKDESSRRRRSRRREEHISDAANFIGGAVYLLNLSEADTRAWLEALSLAMDRGSHGPMSLLITHCSFHVHGLLSGLQRSSGLQTLSLQYSRNVSDECIQLFSCLRSLTRLHLQDVVVSSHFLRKLADLHPSHSPLAASLQSLHIEIIPHGESPSLSKSLAGFLHHWPRLKDLTLIDFYNFKEDDLICCMGDLEQSIKKKQKQKQTQTHTQKTSNSTSLSSSPAPLESLTLGTLRYKTGLESPRSTRAIVDALSLSGLPFLQLRGLDTIDPAIEAQLRRNQRLFILGDLQKVPATSMRLFICGDPFAGKTTLLSTMHSIYAGKRAKLRTLIACGHTWPDRTRGIEVRAIRKDGIRLSLWDMAGHQEFHAFHDCMFPDIGTSSYQAPSLFMFVWSPMHSQTSKKGKKKEIKEFEASFRYWLKFLASKSPRSNIAIKVIVVLTRLDQMNIVASAVSASINSLRSEFKDVIDIAYPPFEVDARKKESVKAVSEMIFKTSKEMLEGVQVYGICKDVSEHLSKYLKTSKRRIITWSEFIEICKHLPIPNDDAKLKAIALSLNDSGIIIYVNNIGYIVLDPNWFCNQIMGSLIHFSESKACETIDIHGFTTRVFLQAKLELLTKSEVKGSLLVDLMEEMHLCCKVPNGLGVSISDEDHLFIPATLTDPRELYVGVDQLRWRSSTPYNSDDNTYVYMGRRLECENKDLNFLTPGLFPRIQVLFNIVFQQDQVNADVILRKDSISICVEMMEIIVVFCRTKSDHAIDVLIRAPNNSQEDMAWAVSYVEERIIYTLITVCAQPTGIQGVKLVESVIRPDSLHDPSMTRNRDQCVEMNYLKQRLRQQLEQGHPPCYVWKETKSMPMFRTTSFVNLIGPTNYSQVISSCKTWLEEVSEKTDALLQNDEFVQHRGHQDATMTSLGISHQDSKKKKILDNIDLDEEEIEEEGVELQCSRGMVREILREVCRLNDKMDVNHGVVSRIDDKVDVNHGVILSIHDKVEANGTKLDDLHEEVKCMREDVMRKVVKSMDKLLKFAVETEAEKQLPRLVILTTEGVNTIRKLVTSLFGDHVSAIRLELYCEYEGSPHPVEKQAGITLTSLSKPLSKALHKALPYINHIVLILSLAAKLSINCLAVLPNWLPNIQGVKEYPMISKTVRPENDASMGTPSIISHVCPNMSEESFREWQKCLASILTDNGGLSDQNIHEKFGLKRTKCKKGDGSDYVAWLCDKHYKGQRPFSLG